MRPLQALLFASIICIPLANGYTQLIYEVQPVNERDVCFIYAELGLPNDDRLKVLVISSYIFRYKYTYGHDFRYPAYGSEQIRTSIMAAFRKKMDEIENSEYNTQLKNRYNQVGLMPHPEIEWAYSRGVYAEGTGPELYLSTPSATYYNFKVREKIISEYREKGYKIFQVSFDEHYEDMEDLQLEHVEKLSALVIAPYYQGSIRALARKYQEEHRNDDDKDEDKAEVKSTKEKKADERVKLEAYKFGLRQGIKSSYEYLKTVDANPLIQHNGNSYDNLVQSLIRECQRYNSTWGPHEDVNFILREANSMTFGGRAASLITQAPDVIGGLVDMLYFIVEYSHFPINYEMERTPSRIYIGYPEKSEYYAMARVSPGLSFLKHPMRQYKKQFNDLDLEYTIDNAQLKSFTTGLRWGLYPKLLKFLVLKLELDTDISFDFSKDGEFSPRPTAISYVLDPKAGIAILFNRHFEVTAGYGWLYAPLRLASFGQYNTGADNGNNQYTITEYINGKGALYVHWSFGIKFGF